MNMLHANNIGEQKPRMQVFVHELSARKMEEPKLRIRSDSLLTLVHIVKQTKPISHTVDDEFVQLSKTIQLTFPNEVLDPLNKKDLNKTDVRFEYNFTPKVLEDLGAKLRAVLHKHPKNLNIIQAVDIYNDMVDNAGLMQHGRHF